MRFRLYYDKDAETIWLNKMCSNGWAFKKFFLGFYFFEKCEPGEYYYQIDLLDRPVDEKDDYVAFMENAKVTVLSQWWKWVFLRKNASDGPFELYTDVESKITHYTKIKNLFQALLIVEIACFLTELFCAITVRSYILGMFTGLLLAISLAILKIVWKCKWKIEQLQSENHP